MILCRSKSESAPRQVKARRVKAEIVHIRKPSLSSSVSSASSTSTYRPSTSHTTHSHPLPPLEMNPLGLHPTTTKPMSPTATSPMKPPPRLSERPYILPQNDRSERYSAGGVHDHDDILEHYLATDSMPAPPTESPTPVQSQQSRSDEGGDYFLYKLHLLEHQEKQRQQVLDAMSPAPSTRTPLPRSRWSESTIQSIDMDESAIDDDMDDDDDQSTEDDEDDVSVLEMRIRPAERQVRHPASWQNFSYKRDPLAPPSPRRPPIKTMDSVDDFVKRGGWKRRGIVFQNEEVRSESSMF